MENFFIFVRSSPGLVPASPGLIVSRLQRENVSCFLPGVLPLVLMSQAFNL
jgi:hypothetical protein